MTPDQIRIVEALLSTAIDEHRINLNLTGETTRHHSAFDDYTSDDDDDACLHCGHINEAEYMLAEVGYAAKIDAALVEAFTRHAARPDDNLGTYNYVAEIARNAVRALFAAPAPSEPASERRIIGGGADAEREARLARIDAVYPKAAAEARRAGRRDA